MTKHNNLNGKRVTTSINLNSRTLDVLKCVKVQWGGAGIMDIFDRLFSTNANNRNEALKWLMDFQLNVLPHSFSFNQKTQNWDFILENAPDGDFPVIPEADKDKYFFDDDGKVQFFPAFKGLTNPEQE